MEVFLNIGLAKISTVLAVLLSVIYILRVANTKFFKGKNKILGNLNKLLRMPHKWLGIILIITGLIHGIYSSDSVLSLNWGTICWVVSVLLGLNFMFKKRFNKSKPWIFYHRVLTVIFILTLVVHIADVKTFKGNFNSNNKLSYEDIRPNSEDKDFRGRHHGESKDTVEVDQSNFDISNVKDGVYYGEASGYRPGLKVEVTVKDKKITDITIVDNNETPKWYNRVVPYLTDKIVEKNTVNVDTISGATRTSVGIINAVRNALGQ